jgi:hypothetical protein
MTKKDDNETFLLHFVAFFIIYCSYIQNTFNTHILGILTNY